MDDGRPNGMSYLDRIRIDDGADRCRQVFQELCRQDPPRAAALLSDPRLRFPCLFLLRAEAEAFPLQRFLSARCVTALGIMRQILEPQDTEAGTLRLSKKNRTVYSALKWIFETGRLENCPGDENDYEEILDISASILIDTYREESILPHLADMIFERFRRGHHTHNLIWAFFRINEPYALRLMAEHIRAMDPQEAELARSLLHLEPSGTPDDKGRHYDEYISWLEENAPFLYFTGESQQYSSSPVVCGVDFEKKYLDKSGRFLSRGEIARCREAFATLGQEDRILLSDYSHKTRNENILQWSRWMRSPVENQIITAMSEGEWTV